MRVKMAPWPTVWGFKGLEMILLRETKKRKKYHCDFCVSSIIGVHSGEGSVKAPSLKHVWNLHQKSQFLHLKPQFLHLKIKELV